MTMRGFTPASYTSCAPVEKAGIVPRPSPSRWRLHSVNFFDVNRFAAAFLGSILVVIVLVVVSDLIFDVDELETNAYGEIEVATSTAEEAEAEEPSVAPLAARLAEGSVEAGERVAKKCAACHNFDDGGRNGIGPNLWGVLGSPRAANADYSYSGALSDQGGDWGYAELEAFLESPKSATPGTKMSFGGIKDPEDRANLILYLRSVSDVELPLPPVGE